MKILLGAIALGLAVPAMAQTADPHAGHHAHKDMQHDPAKTDHDCKACCEKMKASGGKMECLDKKADGKASPTPSADHHGHAGHDH